MKRIALLVAMVGLLLTGVGPTVGVVAAETAAPPTPNCDHYTGGGSVALVSGAAKYVRLNGNGQEIGSVQLCHQGAYYWAYVVFYDYMPQGKWGNAVLEIIRNGQTLQWSCDSRPQGPPNGGNIRVRPGENRCWTPKIYANISTEWIRAVGYRVHDSSGQWDAWGYGARV